MQLSIEPDIHALVASSGGIGLPEFRRQYQMLHQSSPIRAIRFFLFYLDSRGIDAVSESMAFYATSGNKYISVLLDASVERRGVSLPLLRELDPQFLIKFALAVGALTDPAAVLHALQLTPALDDYSILIPWLRSLFGHADLRIRSRSAKLLCQLRPNPGLIRRYLQSREGRIRADVLEALWSPRAGLIDRELTTLLHSALGDPHHRVVANALVGLYRLGETGTLENMVTLCSDKQYLFRAATAWAMGAVHDARAIPALRQLTSDRNFAVRQRASHSLSELTPATPTGNPAEP